MIQKIYLGVVFLALSALAIACSSDDEGGSKGSNTGREPDDREPGVRDDEPAPSSNAGGTDPLATLPDDKALPIVFVHGFSGSAQQFTSQAMRFVANGFPADRLRAYEHDGAGMGVADFIPGLDAMVDEVREKFGTDQVFLIGHSRGTSVSSTYLSVPERAEKVAKYISLDGGGCANISVPCASPAQSTNMRPGQTHPLPGQKHVEVATSKESFAVQWEFLFGEAPEVLEIVKQKAPVEISGRAVNVPANTGREGTKLEVWELADESGMRAEDEPLAKFDIGADGAWGPVTVDPEKRYELVLKDGDYQHHFYEQPFLRSSEFIRLRSGPRDSTSRMNTNVGDHHAAVTVSRMREWTQTDTLEVGEESESGDAEPKNVLSEATGESRIAIYLHDDAATPGESTLQLLPWFPQQPFQTGIDIYLPSSDEPDGTITLTNTPRGDADNLQRLYVANWASTDHTISALFSDFPRD